LSFYLSRVQIKIALSTVPVATISLSDGCHAAAQVCKNEIKMKMKKKKKKKKLTNLMIMWNF